jgi:formylglycine-generating enzyme required for sulfatase activity
VLARRHEEPQHAVTFTKALHVGKYPVTHGQFAAFVKATGHVTDAELTDGGSGYDPAKASLDVLERHRRDFNWNNVGWVQTPDHPVVNVSWYDADAYCKWAAKITGLPVRLLTESEYEYADRGGTQTLHFTGEKSESLLGYGNVADESLSNVFPRCKCFPFDDRETFTCKVGQYKPNAFGLHDTAGNVKCWCGDWYDESLYRRGNVTDPVAHASGPRKSRSVRGTSWFCDPQIPSGPWWCCSHNRDRARPGFMAFDIGFRVCFSGP